MDNWLAILMIVIAILIIIGNLSTFQKSSHHKLRKTNLNELKETLPRNHKTTHKMPSVNKNKPK